MPCSIRQPARCQLCCCYLVGCNLRSPMMPASFAPIFCALFYHHLTACGEALGQPPLLFAFHPAKAYIALAWLVLFLQLSKVAHFSKCLGVSLCKMKSHTLCSENTQGIICLTLKLQKADIIFLAKAIYCSWISLSYLIFIYPCNWKSEKITIPL